MAQSLGVPTATRSRAARTRTATEPQRLAAFDKLTNKPAISSVAAKGGPRTRGMPTFQLARLLTGLTARVNKALTTTPAESGRTKQTAYLRRLGPVKPARTVYQDVPTGVRDADVPLAEQARQAKGKEAKLPHAPVVHLSLGSPWPDRNLRP